MEYVFALLFSSLLASSNVSARVISLEPDGAVCLAAVTFKCMVNETDSLGWRYAGIQRHFFSPSGPGGVSPMGRTPFSIRVIDVSHGIITSIATASNLTRDVNGMTLECSDGLFSSGSSNILNSELNFGGKLNFSSTFQGP
uniref:Ig-like domain-containing protein n=1 Tax=Amphimedon queenslandica TaxID=400682 RepID=A0A1X7T759_AMPQE